MSVTLEQDRIQEVRLDYLRRSRELMGDTAEYARDQARVEARRRSGHMAGAIEVQPEGDNDYQVVAGAPYSEFNEFGTGIYSERPGGRDTPWVYYDPYLRQFFTTEGMTPQPFMRPGYERSRAWFYANADRYFRGT